MIFMLQLDSQNEIDIQREIELTRQDLKKAALQLNQNPTSTLNTPIPTPTPVKDTRPPENVTLTAQPGPAPKPATQILSKQPPTQNVGRAMPAVLPANPPAPTAPKQPGNSYHIRPPQKHPLSLEDSFIETLLDQIVLEDIHRDNH